MPISNLHIIKAALGGLSTLLLCVLVLAGCTTQAASTALAAGQQFCSVATAAGPVVVRLIEATTNVPVIVTGKAADVVAATCALVQGIPVSPPPAPETAPVVAVKKS